MEDSYWNMTDLAGCVIPDLIWNPGNYVSARCSRSIWKSIMYPLPEHLQRPESKLVPFGRDIREDCLSPTVAPVGASSAATVKPTRGHPAE
jgi:hypothetical protein